MRCSLEHLLGQVRRIEHRLGATLPVTEINEEHPSQIPAGVDPADEGDGLTRV
jgi:hypothetical protein